jgi:hypothetical protein
MNPSAAIFCCHLPPSDDAVAGTVEAGCVVLCGAVRRCCVVLCCVVLCCLESKQTETKNCDFGMIAVIN